MPALISLVMLLMQVETTLSSSLVYPYPLPIGHPVTLNCSFALMNRTAMPLKLARQVTEIRISMLSNWNNASTPRFNFALHPYESIEKRTAYAGYPANVSVDYNGVDIGDDKFTGPEILRKTSLVVTFHQAVCEMMGVVEMSYQILGPPHDFFNYGSMKKYLYLDTVTHTPHVTLNPKTVRSGVYRQTVICQAKARTGFARIDLVYKPENTTMFVHQITDTSLVNATYYSAWPQHKQRKRQWRYYDKTCPDRVGLVYQSSNTFFVHNEAMLRVQIGCLMTLSVRARKLDGSYITANEKHRFVFQLSECKGRKCEISGFHFGYNEQLDFGDFKDMYKRASSQSDLVFDYASTKRKGGKTSRTDATPTFLFIVSVLIGVSITVAFITVVYIEMTHSKDEGKRP